MIDDAFILIGTIYGSTNFSAFIDNFWAKVFNVENYKTMQVFILDSNKKVDESTCIFPLIKL